MLCVHRFSFVELDSQKMMEYAKLKMEGVEIQGRKLRVRRYNHLSLDYRYILSIALRI